MLDTNSTNIVNTAELVGAGHPDKFCDQVGDEILTAMISLATRMGHEPSQLRSAIEVIAKSNRVVVTGEVRMPQDVLAVLNIEGIVRNLWRALGYDNLDTLQVEDFVHPQSAEIGSMIDAGGAGDQGCMVGAAFMGTSDMMPLEYSLSRDLLLRLEEAANKGELPYIRSDTKSQVSTEPMGDVSSVIISAQHTPDIGLEDLRKGVFESVVVPVLGDIDPNIVKINAKGSFSVGGPAADAGVLGRKIVVDAYGPRVPVGGGAYSGKDPTKVDRSAAYQCRQIAKTVLADGFADAKSCMVTMAYGIGQFQPEAVTAIVDEQRDVSDWVKRRFADLSPQAIQERLGLWECDGWTYADTASFGHYGRSQFPWERALT